MIAPRLVVDCETGEERAVDLTADELAQREADQRAALEAEAQPPRLSLPERVAAVLATAPELGQETRERLIKELKGG